MARDVLTSVAAIYPPSLEIHVVSDIICPWCFLGKRRLERALDELQKEEGITTTVHWHPWLLVPRLPASGVPKLHMYRRRLGGDEEKLRAMVRELQGLGELDGISFSFDGAIAGPTLDAHRLLWSVRETPDMQGKLVEELFIAYHERGQNPADHKTLLECAAQAGYDHQAAEMFLRSGKGEAEISAEISGAHEAWDMIGGVPHIFARARKGLPRVALDGNSRAMSISVPGAQDTVTFLRVFRRMLERVREATTDFGESSKL